MIENKSDDSQVTEVTPEKGEMQVAPQVAEKHRRLTLKETKYLQARSEGLSQDKAVAVAYDVKDGIKKRTLENMARNIEKRKPVLAILEKQSERAQELLTKLMEDTSRLSSSGDKEGAQYAGVAEKVMNSLLDRVHGKAKQSIDVQSTSVNVNVDLTLND